MPHRTSPLARLATTIASSATADELLAEVAREFARAAHADQAVIRLRDGDELVTRAATGGVAPETAAPATPIDAVAARLAEAGPVRIDPSRGDDAQLGDAATGERVATIYAIPLRDRDTLEGVVVLGWGSMIELDDEHRELLTAMAAPIVAAMRRLSAIEERDAAIVACERALALRDEVLGLVAHDLRNPLNVIQTAVELLQLQVTDAAPRRHFDRIARSVQRADRLVRDLLQVTAIEGTGLVIDRKRVEVVEVVLAALESQHVLTANAHVVVSTDLSPSLPAIDADELRVQEVLENLISNAIKFSPRGGSVMVGAEQRGEMVRIWVHDEGTGIPAAHLPHVFDRFWQGVKRDRRGTGLGLSICRAIVDAHGGRIWAESEPGAGTTMSFTLPVSDAPRAEVEPVQSNILLVDDRPENLVALGAILENPRYKLVTASSGNDALKEALREDIVVALIDVAMPGMDGIEVATHLKQLKRYRDLPILFVTAFGDDPAQIHRAYAAGAADYIVKPLDAEIVRKKVAVFVELAQRLRAGAESSAHAR